MYKNNIAIDINKGIMLNSHENGCRKYISVHKPINNQDPEIEHYWTYINGNQFYVFFMALVKKKVW